ncbi:substrate-binding domain-containing protein [Streptomyces sp. FIT100]|uniref:substrate-binding domain-containing protein n=1 Tax=Streptomyces sp. FIT100 TaxID=2837956 RepID=UPI0021C65C94|nr:substrate-binding domain-containing protein [Streptomyces sp. FIT100]UUN29789.1 substrate-binding domain-containing protein [Streptomyces sp. FIT100]
MQLNLRQEAILRELRRRGSVRARDLAEELGVTPMTIRRDLAALAERGMLSRTHGGAALPRPRAAALRPLRPQSAADRCHDTGPLTLGMVVPTATYYFRQVIHGARTAAESLDARLVVAVSGYDLEADRAHVERLLDSGVDGLLLTPSHPFARVGRALDWMGELPVPAVVVERRPHPAVPLDHLDFVATDHVRGTVQALRHLVALGHRRIALLTTGSATSDGIRQGFDNVTGLFGLACDAPRVVDHQPGSTEGVEAFLDAVVDSGSTAAVAHPDEETALLVQRARARGLFVPDLLAVVDYDDELAALAEIPLTAVEPPRLALGRTAVTLLVRRLRGEPADQVSAVPQEVLLSPALHVRASTAVRLNG